ncbi:MAG: cation-translocating P-type ATPase [Myxococcota bacterium]
MPLRLVFTHTHGSARQSSRSRAGQPGAPMTFDPRVAESQTGDVRDWHARPAPEVVASMETDARSGLRSDEVRRRLEVFGPNALREPKRRSLTAIFAHQFRSPLIYLLLVAAGIALALGHATDALVIVAVLLLNAVIGALQEGRAERSLAALRELATHKARVVRDGRELVVEAREVVPGDILLLEAGDAIAADARLVDGAALQIAEAALTGESVPVGKDLVPLAPDTPLADRHNMVFAGTHVTAGRARVVVVATGRATQIGHIATLAEEAAEPPTPLERRIAQFGRYVIFAAAGLFALVNIVGALRGLPLGTTLMIGISQVVSMVPEGLPVAMTIALAVGVQRMARRNAVVRRLAAVETLGCTTVICSDKTGTLTKNEMTVTAVHLPGGRTIRVTGSGYEPVGEFLEAGKALDPGRDEALRALLEALTLCNDAQLHGPEEVAPQWRPVGDPTEVALLTLAVKGGVLPVELRERNPRRAEIPFDPSKQMMATQHDRPGGSRVVLKGAPEAILPLCGAAPEEAVRAAERMAAQALRVLAVAVADDAAIDGKAGFAALRGRATLVGLVGQLDPPREEVREAVARCRDAGIKPVMVTGDHKATGLAVATSLGIAREDDVAVDGRELEGMSDAELAERIDGVSVFARVHPAQKLRIVEAFQKRGEVVAMTGDGVNDAPALVQADVGVAMGITGTEVAKEAARIVIGDDNFATIVAAVEEGRLVYRNLKKLILYLFATSLAEVGVLIVALLLGYPPPLLPTQILWINLVTDGMMSVTLIMEPPEGDEMKQRPIPRAERILTSAMLSRAAFMVPAMVLSTLGWFTFRLSGGVPYPQVQTETFTLLAVCQWFNVLNCRSERSSALGAGLLRNPWLVGGLVAGSLLQVAVVFLRPLGALFHTVPFSLERAFAIGVVASLVLWVEELRKLVVRRRERRLAPAEASHG